MKRYKKVTAEGARNLSDERGSISILVIALFLLTLTTLMVVTNISAIAIAKRSLLQATEAAAMRGVHTLNKSAYYQGKGGLLTGITSQLLPDSLTGADKSIPIDCQSAPSEVMNELANWSHDNSSLRRVELGTINLLDFRCDGSEIRIQTFSDANLPFVLPFTSMNSFRVYASAGTRNVRDDGFYLFGKRIL